MKKTWSVTTPYKYYFFAIYIPKVRQSSVLLLKKTLDKFPKFRQRLPEKNLFHQFFWSKKLQFF